MNEKNINSNIETGNGEEKIAIYTSKMLMSRDLFYDFSSVIYRRTKNLYLIFLCLVACLVVVNILDGNYDSVKISILISFLMGLTYFRANKAIKINYERSLISAGKENVLNYELFEDKIVSHVDELKREYFYHQITKFFETKNFILLHLQHNLYITINKNSLNANVDEVKAFLIGKCTRVKKKKFIDCSNDKKWSLIFLIAIIVLSVVGSVIATVLKLNALF